MTITEIKAGLSAETKVKEGYKITKLGLIPKEWEASCLDEVLDKIIGGGTPSKDKTEYWNGVIPWASVKDFTNHDPWNTKDTITEEGLRNSSSNLISKRTLITATRMALGKVVYFEIDVAINQDLKALIPNDKILSDFLKWCLTYKSGYIEYLGTGSTVKGISLGEYKAIKIPLPPLPEQKKIADILSTWDKAIETTQALITKLQLRKKGLMQQLLTGKKRLPGFSGEWEVVQFSDVANRLTKKNEELHDNVVTISAQRGFVRQEDFFKKRVASKTLSGYYLVNKGDFCYNKSYSKGYSMGAFKRLDNFEKAVVTTLYICYRLRENVNSDFMVNYFEGGMMVNNLMKIAQEGGRAHGLLNISLGDFFGLKMILPKIEEQTAIAKVLTKADEEINQTQQYLEQLQEQKKGLMQQLLTGQKRVVV